MWHKITLKMWVGYQKLTTVEVGQKQQKIESSLKERREAHFNSMAKSFQLLTHIVQQITRPSLLSSLSLTLHLKKKKRK